MIFDHEGLSRLIDRLRRAGPIGAYPRQALLAYLCAQGAAGRRTPRLLVIDVFDGGGAHGPMCRFSICGDTRAQSFVAPLKHIAVDRKYPAARALVRLVCDGAPTAA
ncbi:hypothetical protein [Methylocystis echinoides]|jgi:hypothetical protein|uniref:hypothetical protein n=1 Tax=Methylocystis echinoides TaxID=29468 RepID=UPI00342DC11F